MSHYIKPKTPFVLTEEDKALLLKWGYLKEDLPQIEEAANVSTFTVDSRSATWETACNAIGRQEFLSGIGRSAFHFTSSREGTDGNGKGHKVSFNSSVLFR